MHEVQPDRWWRGVDRTAWHALFAAGAGWLLDGLDVTLYTIALNSIATEFHLTKAEAGSVASATVFASAIGGTISGILVDRLGRVRMLMASMIFYSLFCALSATSQNLWQLIFWRVLVGLGMGGEWSAGAVLVAETWPAQHRGKAIGLMQSGWAIGYILAAILGALMLPTLGWRVMFLMGFAPALLTLWIRRGVPEPQGWQRVHREGMGLGDRLALLGKPPLRNRAILATATTSCVLFSYWGLFIWIPTYLSSHDSGGAGLGIVKSAAWIVPMQIGAFFGYASFGFLADAWGRRPVFLAFVLGAAAIVPIYGASARSATALLVLGPLVGFLGHGYFSVFGAMLAELFPSVVRGTAQGFCYNSGRAVGAIAPWVIGWLADIHGLGPALGITSAFFVVGAVLFLLLPETSGQEIA